MSEQRRHPPKEDLARFKRAELAASSMQNNVVRHLLKGCDSCAATLRHKPSIREVPNYEKCMNRVEMASSLFEINIETERQLGFQLWDLLESKSAESRLLMVRNDRRFQIWGLFEHILARIRPASREDPFAAVDLAHLAVTLTQLLHEEDYGCERLHDFRGAAYNLLGFAMRKAGDFVGASSAFEGARTELQQGTGDPIEDAMLAVHTASLLFDLGEFADALKLLNGAIRLFRRAGDSHGVGLTFIQQAMILAHTSTPEQGLL
jgi:tetratricopeptide (TPR) repeat protein